MLTPQEDLLHWQIRRQQVEPPPLRSPTYARTLTRPSVPHDRPPRRHPRRSPARSSACASRYKQVTAEAHRLRVRCSDAGQTNYSARKMLGCLAYTQLWCDVATELAAVLPGRCATSAHLSLDRRPDTT